jgi:serine/threonine protein kinase
MRLSTGARLGPYEIQAAIGAGGVGEVYKARDTRLGRTVAIKVLPEGRAADPERRRRFEQEARAVSALNHPHICVLHDIGREGDTDFLVMEHLEGQTLAHHLRKGSLPLTQVLELGAQIADALAAAHRAGIVHRDLKPANVFLTKDGTVKVLDLGLAELLETAAPEDAETVSVAPAGATGIGRLQTTME